MRNGSGTELNVCPVAEMCVLSSFDHVVMAAAKAGKVP